MIGDYLQTNLQGTVQSAVPCKTAVLPIEARKRIDRHSLGLRCLRGSLRNLRRQVSPISDKELSEGSAGKSAGLFRALEASVSGGSACQRGRMWRASAASWCSWQYTDLSRGLVHRFPCWCSIWNDPGEPLDSFKRNHRRWFIGLIPSFPAEH